MMLGEVQSKVGRILRGGDVLLRKIDHTARTSILRTR
jgi:hypothetical protein